MKKSEPIHHPTRSASLRATEETPTTCGTMGFSKKQAPNEEDSVEAFNNNHQPMEIQVGCESPKLELWTMIQKGKTKYMTIREFAEQNPISEPTVRRLVREDKIDHIQPGGHRSKILIPEDALDRVLKQKASNPSPKSISGRTPRWKQ
ncbi:Helix-turn-helix domain protein [Polystyrenella longa]|uniref:Helix-turn-helix domain protein n=1 Tax=Polystyrenella longa TaxID=2528007 RepID=A0A518CKF2_9PLAN|nr:helix-turn-helix domain-containing protein [Polystyrenella longa]QDU79664.1 Helix-turn-helix domain protein [Polystyrenella longa]